MRWILFVRIIYGFREIVFFIGKHTFGFVNLMFLLRWGFSRFSDILFLVGKGFSGFDRVYERGDFLSDEIFKKKNGEYDE